MFLVCDHTLQRASVVLWTGSRSRKLVPILIKNCELPSILRHITLVDYTKYDLLEWFWIRLACSLKEPVYWDNATKPDIIDIPPLHPQNITDQLLEEQRRTRSEAGSHSDNNSSSSRRVDPGLASNVLSFPRAGRVGTAAAADAISEEPMELMSLQSSHSNASTNSNGQSEVRSQTARLASHEHSKTVPLRTGLPRATTSHSIFPLQAQQSRTMMPSMDPTFMQSHSQPLCTGRTDVPVFVPEPRHCTDPIQNAQRFNLPIYPTDAGLAAPQPQTQYHYQEVGATAPAQSLPPMVLPSSQMRTLQPIPSVKSSPPFRTMTGEGPATGTMMQQLPIMMPGDPQSMPQVMPPNQQQQQEKQSKSSKKKLLRKEKRKWRLANVDLHTNVVG